ncbi:MAG: hypothetical protein IK025_05490 [Bacteroidales bacterium]|nr:hypothetical protein [Bacteroidales bacterium]
MKNTKNIEIYVVDNDWIFLKEFDSKFNLELGYRLNRKSVVDEFLSDLQAQDNNNFTVVIINDMIISHGLNTKSVVDILPMIKNIDKDIAVIVLTDNANLELKITSSDLRPDAYIKKDNELYFRLPHTINKIVCSYELKKDKRTLKIAIVIAVIIVLISIIHFIYASIAS